MPHRPTTPRRPTAAVLIAVGTAAGGAAADLELSFLDEAWNDEAVPDATTATT